ESVKISENAKGGTRTSPIRTRRILHMMTLLFALIKMIWIGDDKRPYITKHINCQAEVSIVYQYVSLGLILERFLLFIYFTI
ncbi:MAG: hypothetical protein PVH58_00435, partial [Desulfobacterales bacterium]